jgi:hypothetical protein
MATRYLISLIVAIAIIQTSTAQQIPAAGVKTSQNGTVISKFVVFFIIYIHITHYMSNTISIYIYMQQFSKMKTRVKKMLKYTHNI